MAVRRLHLIVVLLVTLLWVPGTAHCAFEHALGLDAAGDVLGNTSYPAAPACDHCELCQSVDAGVTFSSKLEWVMPAFISLAMPREHEVSVLPPRDQPAPVLLPPRNPGAIQPPPALSTLRKALPARAPSRAS